MANEQSSSWYPASMPNSTADLVARVRETETVEQSASESANGGSGLEGHDSTAAWLDPDVVAEAEVEDDACPASKAAEPSTDDGARPHAQPIETTGESTPTQELHNGASKGRQEAADTWPDDGAEDDGSAWLLQDELVRSTQEPVIAGVQTQHFDAAHTKTDVTESFPVEAVKDAKPQVAEAEVEAAPSIPQVSSSMSFARTVSQEVSFNDDDDGEWTLGRNEPDASSFLPPSRSTNSFPVVQPMIGPGAIDNLPLPSNQALDMMEADEKEAEMEAEDFQRSSQVISPDPLEEVLSHQRTASHVIGGEVEEAAAASEEARFEEGLPLIPVADVANENNEAVPAKSADLFGQEVESEEDDFNRIVKDAALNDRGQQQLERKSTTSVIETLGNGESSQRSSPNLVSEGNADEAAEQAAFPPPDHAEPAPATEDLASKWEQAFGGDDEDDFLLDDSAARSKDIDATAFLGSDDEGLLDDEIEEPAGGPTSGHVGVPRPASSVYTPDSITSPQKSPYAPASFGAPPAEPTIFSQQPPVFPYNATPSIGQTGQPSRPEAVKTQSFADKSKGGYASPYDLPTDLVKAVKPRKRPSLQHISSEPPPAPQRSVSTHYPEHAASLAPASAGLSAPPRPAAQPPHGRGLAPKASAPTLRSKSSFFEELPMSSKPQPSSRHGQRAPSPNQYAATGPPQQPPPPPVSRAVPPPPPPPPSQAVSPPAPASAAPTAPASHSYREGPQATPDLPNLVAPPKANPYAALQSQPASVMPSPGNSSRYSPAPVAQPGGGASVSSRYSPAPSSGQRANGSFAGGFSHNVLPHLPRTSSPLTQFETPGVSDSQTQDRTQDRPQDRRTSSSFEPRLSRVASLPPTREVDEVDEEDEGGASSKGRSLSAIITPARSAASAAETKYNPMPSDAPPHRSPTSPYGSIGSPAWSPKRINSGFAPQAAAGSAPPHASFVPPPRAQTLSPGAMIPGARDGSKPAESTQRQVTAHEQALPTSMRSVPATHGTTARARAQSTTNMVPPTDGRELDPLERWRGGPVMAWGVGGTFVSTFPKTVPRYAMGQNTPVSLRTAGAIKVHNIRDLDPLGERLSKFPGPLKGKSKKRDTIAWLSAGIDALEKELPDVPFHPQLSLEAKRSVERLLLWKLLRVFIEHDGVLEGTPVVDRAVRDVLAPEMAAKQIEGAPLLTGAETARNATFMQADGVDREFVDKMRFDLLKGDRETAVWAAVDKRLWGHAMLISQTVSPDLYKQVAQEFVRTEVNSPGQNNESLAALYKILSGNYDDCVDELVPSHARAGLQLVSTAASSVPTKDAMDGLDKWRETLTLVLSNRSSEDVRGLNALGKLLSSYGRAEAAHICFIFSRNLSVFGGLDDPKSDFILMGSDHNRQSNQFAKEIEALQLSEIYEYGLTLGGGVAAATGAPHLAAYKLQHATSLAEHGYREKALQYCEAIASAIISQTRRSPYHHPLLEASVEDFTIRLKQAPKDATSSWISKPTMGRVSDSMWNKFNKFVSGDEDGNGHAGSDGDIGPFARIASSPNMSRPPSSSDLDTYGSSPGFQAAAAAAAAAAAVSTGAAASRYAPASSVPLTNTNTTASPYLPATQSQYAPVGTAGGNARGHGTNSYEPSYPESPPIPAQSGGYQPISYPGAASLGLQPAAGFASVAQAASAQNAQTPSSSGYQPYGLQGSADNPPQHPISSNDAEQDYEPPSYGYEAPQMTPVLAADNGHQEEGGSGGYEPPSFEPYSYEPPSHQPDADDGDAPAPKKKKSFMDDDDDDDGIHAPRKPQAQSKADRDRDNEEMFRKAAEEDAKRAAAVAAASSKKGWGFGGWFGGGKKAEGNIGDATAGKPIKAKLGEQSSFVYDPDLKRWINKKPGAENTEVKKATPPPPKAGLRSASGTPPPPAASGTPPPVGRFSVPPAGHLPPRPIPGHLSSSQSSLDVSAVGGPPGGGLSRSASDGNVSSPAPPSAGPPSRPTTSMSNASSIDDLLGAPAPRKAGQKKPKKGGRYVDVMAK